MAITTTNFYRKELFTLIDDVVREMQKKIDNDFDNIGFSAGHMDTNCVEWKYTAPKEVQEDDDDMRLELKGSDDDGEDTGHFGHEVDKGLKIGFTFVSVKINHPRDSYKIINVILISSRVGKQTNIVRTHLKWYEHLHPSVFKLKRLLEHARQKKSRKGMIKIEHDLSKIIPNRIDNILLGESKDEKDGDS